MAGLDKVPEKYRKLVENYYRRKHKKKRGQEIMEEPSVEAKKVNTAAGAMMRRTGTANSLPTMNTTNQAGAMHSSTREMKEADINRV